MKAPLVVSIALLVLLAPVPCPARAAAHGLPTATVQWVVADMMANASEDWRPGMGFNLSASLPFTRTLDLRADWGGRWLEGESRLVTDPDHKPRWGGQVGETTEGLRYNLYTDREGEAVAWNVAGPTCDSVDVVMRDELLPADLQEGDFIFIKNAGAYTTAYASNFNGFPLPEVRILGAQD